MATLTLAHIDALKKIVGENFVFADEENLEKYGHDETERLQFNPEVVVKPRTAEEISAIMKLCNQDLIPVTPRGAGTGLKQPVSLDIENEPAQDVFNNVLR
ncbi:MAG: FAD-binding protein, partial [Chitinophagaceae bacterium]|nr:FAD-binding protein [Chitinophagaceae bacterium]